MYRESYRYSIITTILECFKEHFENKKKQKKTFSNIEYFVHVEIGLKFLNLSPLGAKLICGYYQKPSLADEKHGISVMV